MKLRQILTNLNNENISKLYMEYRQPIFLFVLNITKNYSLSEDITEEIFIRIIKYHKTYNPIKNPKTWIFTITKNTINTYIKKYKEIPYETETLENILNKYNKIKDENSLIVEEYLSYLNEEERNIVILHIFGGLNCLEISKLLNMTHSQVRSKYSYALKKLRRKIDNE